MPQAQIEELLERIWTAEEAGRHVLAGDLNGVLEEVSAEPVIQQMVREGLVLRNDAAISFTALGREKATEIIRRHRLAERLLVDVLDIGLSETESSACEFEHCLGKDVTDSICTLLGHPKTCPHGRQIPPGECCRAARKDLQPVIVSVHDLDVGDTGKVVYIHSHEREMLHRLASLGVLPGAEVRLHQKVPSFVVTLGESEVAFDEQIARAVFVRRSGVPPSTDEGQGAWFARSGRRLRFRRGPRT